MQSHTDSDNAQTWVEVIFKLQKLKAVNSVINNTTVYGKIEEFLSNIKKAANKVHCIPFIVIDPKYFGLNNDYQRSQQNNYKIYRILYVKIANVYVA
jgi:hypothetical protein